MQPKKPEKLPRILKSRNLTAPRHIIKPTLKIGILIKQISPTCTPQPATPRLNGWKKYLNKSERNKKFGGAGGTRPIFYSFQICLIAINFYGYAGFGVAEDAF